MQRFGTAVPLGSGSSAEVYQAYDSLLQQDVALKLLRRREPHLVARMFREADAQAKIDHPGICRVYETGQIDDRPFISMQLVEGRELGAIAEELDLDTKLELMIEVAEAAHEAHRHGLVHRDLTPDNILVQHRDGRLRPVIVDFGLVVDLDASEHLTQEGEPIGTPAFMAPEQASGRVGAVDARTDVYGLGATLFALLTGRPPFDGRGTAELLIQALEEEPTRPSTLTPELPPAADCIIFKCLEKRPEFRYASAADLASDLRRLRAGEPCEAEKNCRRRALARRLRVCRRFLPAAGVATAVASMALWNAEAPNALPGSAVDPQRFIRVAHDLDWMLRSAQMSSRHDVTPIRFKARQRVAELESELRSKGDPSGAAHYAVGRGYAVLRQDEAAQGLLEEAWTRGYREPEVAYFLGLVLGRRYEDALERVGHLNGGDLRQRYEDDARQRYLVPAREYLKHGRGAEVVSVDHVEALIDFYDDRLETALSRLDSVEQQHPWLYESHLLRGKILRRRGQDRAAESDLAAAIEHFGAAEAALRRALQSAGSDPEIYAELCRLLSLKTETEFDWSVPPSDEVVEGHLNLCEQGLEVAPNSSRILRATAIAHELMARLALYRKWQPEKARGSAERALELALRAVQNDPDVSFNHQVLGRTRTTLGQLKHSSREGDQLLELRQAGQALQKAWDLSTGPRGALTMLLAGNFHLQAQVLTDRRLPAEAELRQAARFLDTEINETSRSFELYCVKGHNEVFLAMENRAWNRPFGEILDRAETAYRQCLELNPNHIWAFLGVADVKARRAQMRCDLARNPGDELETAHRWIDRAQELDPEFEFIAARRAGFLIVEAECLMARESSSAAPIRLLDSLVGEAAASQLPGHHEMAFYANYLRLKQELLRPGAPDSGVLRPVIAAYLEDVEPIHEKAQQDWAVDQRYFRIDHLLWLLAGARVVGLPEQAILQELEIHWSRLQSIDDGRLWNVPQQRMLRAIYQGMTTHPTNQGQIEEARHRIEKEAEQVDRMRLRARLWLDLLDRRGAA